MQALYLRSDRPAVPEGKNQRETGQRKTGRRPTRDDVAELAGVSSAVVSYVMNDGPRNVAPATRQRVLDAVAELGYRPNVVARNLRSQTNRMVGLVLDSSASAGLGAVTTGITEALTNQSYILTVAHTGVEADQETDSVRLLAQRVDGVLFVPAHAGSEVPSALRDEGVPVMAIGVPIDDAASVFVEPDARGFLAMQHLISLGHTRIGVLLRTDQHVETNDYLVGCERALTAARIDIDPRLIITAEVTTDAGSAAAAQLLELDEPPTAVITQSDLTALGVLDELQQRDAVVPRDFSIVSADDLELGQHTTPALTSVPAHSEEVGRTAANALLRLISNEAVPVRTTVDPEVVHRDSSGAAPPS